MEKVNEQKGMSEKMMDGDRAAFESYRDKRNALLEGEGHAPRSKWRVSNAHYPTWEAAIAYASASLPVGVPDGYALVPVDPTPEMQAAALRHVVRQHTLRDVWKDMCGAAPIAQTAQLSAPERVSVPKFAGLKSVNHQLGIVTLSFKSSEQTQEAVRELRALLASHAKTGKANP